MGRRTLLLIASILVAATGTGVVALYARNAKQVGEAGAQSVKVWVALRQVPAGMTATEALDSKRIQLQDRPVAVVPENAVTDIKPIAAQKALVDIPVRSTLTLAQFSPTGSNAVSNPVGLGGDKGLVALSINVADVDRVAGFVQPGNYVALIALTNADDPKRAASHMLFQKPVKVLQIAPFGGAAAAPGQTLVTLELTQEQANEVVLAAAQAKITMAYVTGPDATFDTGKSAQVPDILPSGAATESPAGN